MQESLVENVVDGDKKYRKQLEEIVEKHKIKIDLSVLE